MVYYCFTHTKAYPKWFLHQRDVVFYDLWHMSTRNIWEICFSFIALGSASDVRKVWKERHPKPNCSPSHPSPYCCKHAYITCIYIYIHALDNILGWHHCLSLFIKLTSHSLSRWIKNPIHVWQEWHLFMTLSVDHAWVFLIWVQFTIHWCIICFPMNTAILWICTRF